MSRDKVLCLFECCLLTRGNKYSILMDTQRKTYTRMPNQLADLIENALGKTLSQLKLHYDNKFDNEIVDNIKMLEDQEYLFYTENLEWFPAMSVEWDEPTPITNGIIDIDPEKILDFKAIWGQLSNLGCEHVQIRAFSPCGLEEIEAVLDLIGKLRIISIELILPYDANLSDQDYIDFVYRQPRVFSITLYSALEDKQVFLSPTGMGNIFYLRSKVNSSLHCGIINENLFRIHIKSYSESQLYNSCLNRKISIDIEGNIKNCPSMKESYGNINESTLVEAIKKPGFKKYWNLNKDKIHVCKDCEFRYICTDCRAYIENPEEILSKPLKCGYDPYAGEWNEWCDNPLKQKAIDFYGMREMV